MSMASSGAGRAPGPLVAPAGELADDGQKVLGALGQLVVDPRRDLAVALAGQQSVGNHAIQPRAQLFGGDPGQDPLQLDEPARAACQVADDKQRPLVTHEIQGPCIRGPLVVGVALGGGVVRACRASLPFHGNRGAMDSADHKRVSNGGIRGRHSGRLFECRARRKVLSCVQLPSSPWESTIMLIRASIAASLRRAAPSPGRAPASARARATFSSTSCSPGTYLAAERVERMFPRSAGSRRRSRLLHAASCSATAASSRGLADAETRAAVLRVPLVWPERGPRGVRPAMRAAALACEMGPRSPVRPGGEPPGLLRGLRPRRPRGPRRGRGGGRACRSTPALAAAGDVAPRRGRSRPRAGACWRRGADRLPALRVGRRLFAARSASPEARRRPR